MESLTRRKARPTIFFILCLLIIFKLVTTINSAQIDNKMISNISRKLLGRAVPEKYKYPPRSPHPNLLHRNFAPEEPGLPPITLRSNYPPPAPPRSLLHHVFPWY
ncbi:hypothetical protein MKX01_019330 [Papaver californicum]|nr:hypothetical protein MKX01_019330 [Papaver californicum]